MTVQLRLLPSSPPAQRFDRVALDRLEGYADASPSRELCEQLRALGQLQPIIAVPSAGGQLRIVDGRRRAKAIAQLAEQGQWPEPVDVDAVILNGGESARRTVQCGLTLALHASRSFSPASELAAIETILRAAGPEEEAATVKQIAAQTGLNAQTVRRRLRLRFLIGGLRAAFDRGGLPTGVAEAAARLPRARQEQLARGLAEGGRLTLADVRNVAREETATATGELPDALFTGQQAAWQATVRGHLRAALEAIPPGPHPVRLAELVAQAIAESERL